MELGPLLGFIPGMLGVAVIVVGVEFGVALLSSGGEDA
jgi:hypothetical protein